MTERYRQRRCRHRRRRRRRRWWKSAAAATEPGAKFTQSVNKRTWKKNVKKMLHKILKIESK